MQDQILNMPIGSNSLIFLCSGYLFSYLEQKLPSQELFYYIGQFYIFCFAVLLSRIFLMWFLAKEIDKGQYLFEYLVTILSFPWLGKWIWKLVP